MAPVLYKQNPLNPDYIFLIIEGLNITYQTYPD